MPVVRTDGREYGHVITKFSLCGRLLHFLTHGAPLRARELRYKRLTEEAAWINGMAQDSQYGDSEFKSHLDHQMNLFLVVPGSNPGLCL